MRKDSKFTEEELAEVTRLYFEAKAWKMYPEVVLQHFGGRADFVGTKQQLCMAVECKTTFSYTVLEQLTRWRHEFDVAVNSKYADDSKKGIPHLLYAVVGGSRRVSDLKMDILQAHRIGLIEVTCERGTYFRSSRTKPGQFDSLGYANIGEDRWRFNETLPARIQPGSRRIAHRIVQALDDDMMAGKAGASGKEGAYITPFKRTLAKAETILARGGEWHIQHIIDAMNAEMGGHHYSSDISARSSLASMIEKLGVGQRVDAMRPVFTATESPRSES